MNMTPTNPQPPATPEEEYDFYAQPENQEPQGPPRRRSARLTAPVPVRFPPEVMEQIRQQIELLALQAQEIQKRKELSLMIYNAKLSFKPNIGQTYYLYEKNDSSHMLSLVSPKEWGGAGPFKKFVAAVQLLADHTWKEL